MTILLTASVEDASWAQDASTRRNGGSLEAITQTTIRIWQRQLDEPGETFAPARVGDLARLRELVDGNPLR
jgi:hypothetical protein